ncbi:hypothetical protein AURDEDRAFT_130582 [Auricularia subglabra TFB-10046 SS5]|nr:hypothetical protein AURDEDRAFT_130582 [Auricularia subglabra TFB-10046 SS5]
MSAFGSRILMRASQDIDPNDSFAAPANLPMRISVQLASVGPGTRAMLVTRFTRDSGHGSTPSNDGTPHNPRVLFGVPPATATGATGQVAPDIPFALARPQDGGAPSCTSPSSRTGTSATYPVTLGPPTALSLLQGDDAASRTSASSRTGPGATEHVAPGPQSALSFSQGDGSAAPAARTSPSSTTGTGATRPVAPDPPSTLSLSQGGGPAAPLASPPSTMGTGATGQVTLGPSSGVSLAHNGGRTRLSSIPGILPFREEATNLKKRTAELRKTLASCQDFLSSHPAKKPRRF